MKKKHRELLSELCGLCNQLGGDLDGTATHESKYKDRQKANMLSYKILYAVLADHPENDNNEINFEAAETALVKMRELTKKTYPDRKGLYGF